MSMCFRLVTRPPEVPVTFADSDDLTIGSVTADSVPDAGFGGTTGVSTNNGDITIDAGNTLNLTQAVNSGTADVRLIADGDITQTVNGIITGDELGIRQESNAIRKRYSG